MLVFNSYIFILSTRDIWSSLARDLAEFQIYPVYGSSVVKAEISYFVVLPS